MGCDDVRLLIDTHVLIWFFEGGAQLGSRIRRTIEAAAGRSEAIVSAISFWEVAMLQRRGRIALSLPVERWREAVLASPGIIEAPLDSATAIEAALLPDSVHRDPADRFLIATARLQHARICSQDRRIVATGRTGLVDVLTA
jgi:PIN domain nuclease of toxin-antitoxin system